MNPPECPALTVLVVEDEVVLADAIARLLERHRCRVLRAADGGLARSLGQAEEIDVVFCDYNLEGSETGLDVLRWFRHNRPQCNLWLVTGSLLEGQSEFDVIEKPCRFDRFLDIINALRRRRSTNGL